MYKCNFLLYTTNQTECVVAVFFEGALLRKFTIYGEAQSVERPKGPRLVQLY